MTMAGLRTSTIEAIHSSPTQCVVFIAGGASQVIGWLTSVPGASNTLIEAVVPYSRTSMIQLLGKVAPCFFFFFFFFFFFLWFIVLFDYYWIVAGADSEPVYEPQNC